MKERIYRTYDIEPEAPNTLILVPDIKNYLQIDVLGDDGMLERLATTAFDLIMFEYDIVSVRSAVTERIVRANDEFSLKFKPVVSGSCSIVDDSGLEPEFEIVSGQYSSLIQLQDKDVPEKLIVTYTAGFGVDENNINDPLYNIVRQGVMQMVGTLYQDRENNVIGTMSEIPSSTRRLIENSLNINTTW